MALTHSPEIEYWTTNDFACEGEQIKRLGLNFGAPGDRRVASGTLWLDTPSVGGASPNVPVRIAPEKPRWYYRHSSRIKDAELAWVAASGVEGLEELAVTLGKGVAAGATYTVRLYFAEVDPRKPGERVFSAALQGKTVIEKMDIVREAGGADKLVIKEFKGVKAAKEMVLKMKAVRGKTLISGIEVIAETPE